MTLPIPPCSGAAPSADPGAEKAWFRMDYLLPVVVTIVAVLGLVWRLFGRRSRSEVQEPAGDRLDTLAGWPPATTQILRTSERIAYSTLRLALPGYMILAQVPIARFDHGAEAKLVRRMDAAPRQPVRRPRRL